MDVIDHSGSGGFLLPNLLWYLPHLHPNLYPSTVSTTFKMMPWIRFLPRVSAFLGDAADDDSKIAGP